LEALIPERTTRIRLRLDEADAKDLEGILTETKEDLIAVKRRLKEKGEDVGPVNRTLKRVTFMVDQLRREMVDVGWLPPEVVPNDQ